jgi:hypothetical protein
VARRDQAASLRIIVRRYAEGGGQGNRWWYGDRRRVGADAEGLGNLLDPVQGVA